MIEIVLFLITGFVYLILFLIVVFLIFIGLGYLGGLLVPRNENYQVALDRVMERLLHTEVEDLLKIPRNVQAKMKINDEIIEYTYGKDYLNDDLIRIILHTTQKTKFGWYYNFLNGIKITEDKEVIQLTDEELADYD